MACSLARAFSDSDEVDRISEWKRRDEERRRELEARRRREQEEELRSRNKGCGNCETIIRATRSVSPEELRP